MLIVLLFETERGGRRFVSAGQLGQQLNEQNVSLVVLSACQSAMFASTTEPDDELKLSGNGPGGPTPKQLLFPETSRQRSAGQDDDRGVGFQPAELPQDRRAGSLPHAALGTRSQAPLGDGPTEAPLPEPSAA